MTLTLRTPTRADFPTRQRWLSDPAMMAYNAGWDVSFEGYDRVTGCIDWPESLWDTFAARLAAPPADQGYFFVEEDSQPLGHVHYRVEGSEASIGFNVIPSRRGQGLGEPFLQLLVARVWTDTSAATVVNEFEDERIAAAAVHRACGFQPAPEVQTTYGRPTRRWVLRWASTRSPGCRA